MRIIFLLFTILVVTSACNKKLKETVGISTSGPNEYQVQRSKMLEVPPHYDLPAPASQQLPNNKGYVPGGFNEGEKALIQEMN
ncbi:DUF3035 domain-containing protein [Rickettsia endosymbiont of Halotydeus destructor]|uniref:DUF3035 domain-containing protein n=1 Tax=Rickettsia endosymbiont of Halotydeus destructor TaxID=2996754 RepID=UPI003BB2101C